MANSGVYPPDSGTDIGLVRILLQDTDATNIDPDAGTADYGMFSDSDLAGFLVAGSDSPLRGVGFAYLSLAGQAALKSKSVKDFDLAVDLTKRAADLRAQATLWFDRAEAGETEDYFDIVSMGSTCDVIPELTVPEYGRIYTWGKVC